MDLRSFLNTLLIGLTLSTIILTLIVYFIFKIRQGYSSKGPHIPYFIDGIYFRRISPRRQEENQRATEIYLKKEQLKEKKTRIPGWGIFALVFCSMILFLSIDRRFAYLRILQERSIDKTQYQDLVQKGLLQEHEFQSDYQQSYLQYPQIHLAEQTNLVLQQLRSIKIFLYENSQTQTREYSLWSEYLTSLGLNLVKIHNLASVSPGNILLIPSTKDLSKNEITFINKLSSLNVGILLSGVSGTYFFSSYSNSNSHDCLTNASVGKTVQAHIDVPWTIPWSTPAKAPMNFRQLNSCDLPLEKNALASVRKMSNEQPLAFAQTRENSRWLWVNIAPNNQVNYGSINDLFWSQSFLYLAKPDLAVQARWNFRHQLPISLVIASDSSLESLPKIQNLLLDRELISTSFVPSSVISTNGIALHAPSSLIQYASTAEPGEDLTKFSVRDLFHRTQENRHKMEIFKKDSTLGFRFPSHRFSWDILTSIQQNQFLYFLGTDDFSWRQPVPLAENFYYIPSSEFQLKTMMQRKQIASKEDFQSYLDLALQKSFQSGGMAVITIDPDFFGKEPQIEYLKAALDLLMKKYSENIVSMEELIKDVQERESSKISLDNQGELLLESATSDSISHALFWSTKSLPTNSQLSLVKSDSGLNLYEFKKSMPPQEDPLHLPSTSDAQGAHE